MRAENSPLHRAHRCSRGRRCTRADQIGHGFGLRDVHLAVQKGALAELARPRHPATELERPLQQQIHHQRAAVPLQFQDVLTGERCGAGKYTGEALIDAIAASVEKIRASRARRGGSCMPRIARAIRGTSGTGNPNDADGASARGGRDGDYGVGRRSPR